MRGGQPGRAGLELVMTPPILQCRVVEARPGMSVEAGGERRKAMDFSRTVAMPRSVDVFTVCRFYSVSLLLHAMFVVLFFCFFNDSESCGPDILSWRLSWEILHSQRRFPAAPSALFSFVFFWFFF